MSRTPEEIDRAYRDGIAARNPTEDVETDFIPHVVTGPAAEIIADVTADVDDVTAIVTVQEPERFVGDLAPDLDRRLLDEGITPAGQSFATVTLTWYRYAPPTEDLVARRGEVVGTQPDAASSGQIRYAGSETGTLPLATAASYFNLTRRRYELNVPAVSTIPGSAGVVGAGRLTRPQRALAGWDGVENLAASSDASDGESAGRKVERWNLSIRGEQLATRLGLIKSLLARYRGRVRDAYAAGVRSGVVTRAPVNGSPVDCFIVGSTLVQSTETYTYLGRGQLIPVAFAPLVSVASVRDVGGGVVFTEGVDYLVTTGRSTSDLGGVRFTAAGAVPAVGAPITVTYNYDGLIRELQEAYQQDDLDSDGRDLLFVRAIQVPIVQDWTLTVSGNFNAARVRTLVRARILAEYGSGRLGADVELSDVNALARRVPGTGNFTANRVSRASVVTGVSDIQILPYEYTTLADVDLVIR